MMLWSAMHENYKQIGMGWQTNSDISRAYHGNRGWNYPNLVDYMENHDQERVMFEALSNGNSSGNYNIRDTVTALNQMELTTVLMMGIPGPKMVWQFGELGYDYSIMYNGDRTAPKPPRWDYFDQPERQRLYRVYSGMASLRKCDAFRFGTFTSDLGGLGKRMWISHNTMNVVIAGNMNVASLDMAPGFPGSGQWYDYFSGQVVTITDPVSQTFNFGPGEFRVFTSVQQPRPFHDVAITVKDSVSNAVLSGAEITVEGSGIQRTDQQGRAFFTAFPGTALIKVTRPNYKTWTKTVAIANNLDLTVLLKPGASGLNDFGDEQKVRIFPNPAKQSVSIEVMDHYQVGFYSFDGSLIMSDRIQNKIQTFDLAGFHPGIYTIRFKGEGVSFSRKLVVVH
jgi:hypothetical protein